LLENKEECHAFLGLGLVVFLGFLLLANMGRGMSVHQVDEESEGQHKSVLLKGQNYR